MLLMLILAVSIMAGCGARKNKTTAGAAGPSRSCEVSETVEIDETVETDEIGETTETEELTLLESEETDAAEDTVIDDSSEEDTSEAALVDAFENVTDETAIDETAKAETSIDENGAYTTKEDVALYIHTYNKLPSNFITKKQAEKLGWQGGGLDDYMDGGCIGGTYFGNYEGALPEKNGREYHECDIDTMHSSRRGAKRIVYSNDGLIYYTGDHYETFELLYGEE